MAARDGGLQIPNKLYFRIGEVSEITGVQPYTLRHWEMEFPTLSPKKNDSGQRLYRKEDIEMVHTIQRLLHSEGYTTAGARRLLGAKSGKRGRPVVPKPPPAPKPEPATVSSEVVTEVRDALELMDANDKRLAALEE
ncbi:MAG: MerR family transcriptional regulator [Acidobacteriota bacterium]|nr:MerR family transcriptional regulator [Acidobacteriota bacterium]